MAAVVVAAIAVAVPVAVVPTASATPTQRSDEVDLLRADAESVREQIEETQQARDAAFAALEAMNAEVEAARTREAEAAAAVADAQVIVDEIDAKVAASMREAYTSSNNEYPLEVAYLTDANEASMRVRFMEHRAKRFDELLKEQEKARSALQVEQKKAAAATAEVEAGRSKVEELIASIDSLEANQVALVSAIEDRLDAALAEAAAIEAIDAAAAAAIVAREQELQRVAMMAAPKTTTTTAPPAVAPTPGATPTTAPPAPTPTTARPTTAPPVTTPITTPGPVAVTTVRGIVVSTSIAANLDAMLGAGAAAGLTFGGSGYRDINSQINLRIKHCGPTDYDIWQKPSSQCSPPTAIPGRSMHEKGLAVDLTCSGALIQSRTSPCFVWLAANAAGFGFYNLPSEPWHWSTTGS